MKSEDLIARVRYNKGIQGVEPDHGEKALDEESFILEVRDPETKTWSINTIATLRKCKEFPDAKEREFINYSFMMEIFKLQRLGYHVYFSKETCVL